MHRAKAIFIIALVALSPFTRTAASDTTHAATIAYVTSSTALAQTEVAEKDELVAYNTRVASITASRVRPRHARRRSSRTIYSTQYACRRARLPPGRYFRLRRYR